MADESLRCEVRAAQSDASPGCGANSWRSSLECFVLISFGDGVVAVAVAGLPGSGRTASPTTIFNAAGDWLLITWGWAMAVAFAIWVAGGVSGAHLNPAVTLAFAARRKFAWAKVLPYWGAQVLGRVRRRRPGVRRVRQARSTPFNLVDAHAEERRAGTRRRTRSSPRSRPGTSAADTAGH